uniref:Uncharacterized protein n=1 Tax=Anguilla anguilla TaxID=7936 RepID=A0A0E9PV75_ANGAN
MTSKKENYRHCIIVLAGMYIVKKSLALMTS